MAKKIVGIILIILGSYFIVMTAVSAVNLTKTSQQERIEQDLKEYKGVFTMDEIKSMEDSNHRFAISFLIIAPIIGGALLWGGFALFKSGKKQSKHNDSLKDFN